MNSDSPSSNMHIEEHMRIVNTFISDDDEIPPYTEISLRRARASNPYTRIDFICKKNQPYFSSLGVRWVDQNSLSSDLLTKFNEVCWFKRHGTPGTTFPSPELFWHRTAERIYYLAAYLAQERLENIFHFENDVLIYGHLDTVEVNDKITVTNMSPTHTTFAFCHIPTHQLLSELCENLNILLEHGEHQLLSLGFDHISEMSLLNLLYRKNLIESFPILPSEATNWVFDPGSYGQYFAGTNNGHPSGFTDPTHIIGREILNGNIAPQLLAHDIKPLINNSISSFKRKIRPCVVDRQSDEEIPIFSLHVHSKKLDSLV